MGFILLRYGEVGLKGNNRYLFIRQLRRNVRAALKAHNLAGEVVSKGQRIYVYTDQVQEALDPLARVFGLVSLSPATEISRDPAVVAAECVRQAIKAGVNPRVTYRVRARRSDKDYPLNSPQISRMAGEAVYSATGGIVDLTDNAQVTISIEITHEKALIFGQTVPALGGLPVSTEGRVVALLSGGIDSPVAAWMMLKRGCGIIPLHFNSNPADLVKVQANLDVLQHYSYGWQFHPTILSHSEVVGPVLERLQAIGEQRWGCIMCKRAMLKKACEVAEQWGAQAIVTGDSMGQVASQTLANMAAISYGITMPILRPLIGMDKNEIVDLARKIGTFDISISESASCKFLPNRPVTQGSLEHLRWILTQIEQPA
ncbi:MAG: tRNA uracil 4-sulfurtransferase ThiI [Anaerolineae bacterium]